VPPHNGVRLHDRQRIAHSWEQPAQTNEDQSVDEAEGRFLWSRPPQNVYLLAQDANLGLKRCSRPKQIYEHPANEPANVSHRTQHRPIRHYTPTGLGLRHGHRMRALDRFRQLNACHFRHGKVCENEINFGFALKQPKRFPSTRGWNRQISEAVEHFACAPEDGTIVVDDEDGQVCFFGLGTLIDIRPFAVARQPVGTRQEDLDQGTLPNARLDFHASSRLLGKTKDLRQSEAGASSWFLGGEKWFEHSGKHVVRNTDPGIVYSNAHVRSLTWSGRAQRNSVHHGVKRFEG
jgi:hypothetical protein